MINLPITPPLSFKKQAMEVIDNIENLIEHLNETEDRIEAIRTALWALGTALEALPNDN